MTAAPGISVLLPTYNGGRFLREQIESILGQSDSDLEVIVVDDGSTDDSVAIVDEYARRDARIRRLPSAGNLGQRDRLIELADVATGTFIAIADQDDVWDRDRNARLLSAVGDRAVAFGRSQLVDQDNNALGGSLLAALDVDAPAVGPLSALFVDLLSAHAALIRRSWLNRGAFYGALPFDRALGLEALFSTGLVYVDGAVVRHRIHGSNQSNASVGRTQKTKMVSPYRAKASLSFLQPSRLWFGQTLDQLGRSSALPPPLRADFAWLAGQCWHHWFGSGGDLRALEAEFHRRLAPFARDAADLAFFAERLRSLSRRRFAPVNLRLSWRYYRRGP